MTTSAEHGRDDDPLIQPRHRMRIALEHGGVSIGEMARLIGVDRNTVGNYLGGRSVPRDAVLRVWAMRTGVTLDWIKTGRQRPDDDGGGDGGTRVTGRVNARYLHHNPGRVPLELVAA